jgi:transcriptional regulator, XRE family
MLPTIEEIGKMRKNLGISQKELARTCGVSQSYIARMEKGSINPTYDKIRKIYDYLSVFSRKSGIVRSHCKQDYV